MDRQLTLAAEPSPETTRPQQQVAAPIVMHGNGGLLALAIAVAGLATRAAGANAGASVPELVATATAAGSGHFIHPTAFGSSAFRVRNGALCDGIDASFDTVLYLVGGKKVEAALAKKVYTCIIYMSASMEKNLHTVSNITDSFNFHACPTIAPAPLRATFVLAVRGLRHSTSPPTARPSMEHHLKLPRRRFFNTWWGLGQINTQRNIRQTWSA